VYISVLASIDVQTSCRSKKVLSWKLEEKATAQILLIILRDICCTFKDYL